MICMCRNHSSAICKTVVTGRVHRRAARWQRDSGRKVERESVFKNIHKQNRQTERAGFRAKPSEEHGGCVVL